MVYQHFQLHRDIATPIYLQLYWRFRDAITEGRLSPGDRVPSVRGLALILNLSRGTVEQAYQLLTGEGYLFARGAAGTVVNPQLAGYSKTVVPASVLAPLSNIVDWSVPQSMAPLPFRLGLPALDAFPRKTWVRLAGHNLRCLDVMVMSHPTALGYEPLRKAIAAYLAISRGISCLPEQVFVTAGYRGALDLICRTLLRSGDSCWFEDPGYLHAQQFLTLSGIKLVSVPVDSDGLNVALGMKHAIDARAAVVTPSHQSPLGVTLSLRRRYELLDWASANSAWIIEDDYDSEFRYHGRPLPALKSLDRQERVLYTGTFSKVLFPGLRLAYLVVPVSEIKRFQHSAQVFNHSGSVLMQATVADFMNQGHFVRHLKKMRNLYALRRGYLLSALQQVFGERLSVEPQAGGIHVLARFNGEEDDRDLAERAKAHGLAVEALSEWSLHDKSLSGLLLGFTNILSPDDALHQTRLLCSALGWQE